MKIKTALLLLLLLCWHSNSLADEAPWGKAAPADKEYTPAKVLYDLTSGRQGVLSVLLDRVSYLYKLQGSDPFDTSIVVIVHGSAIPMFARKNLLENQPLMERAQSLTLGTTIEFRMCQASAALQGFSPADIHGFVKMIPMADAEIVELQEKGYAYMR